MRIFFTRPIPDIYNSLLIQQGYELDIYEKDEVCPREILIKRARGAIALLTQAEDKIDSKFFENIDQPPKIIANFASGYNNIDLTLAKEWGIVITNTPVEDVHYATAEAAVSLLMSVAKRIVYLDNIRFGSNPPEYSPIGEMGVSIRGKVSGIIGAGNIGHKVAKIMHLGFDNKILYYSRTVKPLLESEQLARKVELNELLSLSDFIFVTIPLTPTTRGLLDEDKLILLKQGSVLISISREGIIDENALLHLLSKKIIFGAGLDDYSSQFGKIQLSNLVLTSHMANTESETTLAMANLCIRNILAVLNSHHPLTPVF